MKILLIAVLIVGFTLPGFCYNAADSSSYYLSQANELVQLRKLKEADKSFQKAVSFNPAEEIVRIAYGNYLSEQRRFFAAIEQYAKVLEANINHAVALKKMTEISFQLRKWNDVVMYGKKLLQNDKSKEAKFMIGKSFYELENFGEAQKYLNEVVEEDPQNHEGIRLLGKVLVELGNYKQAINTYNKSLAAEPENNQLIYELGLLYYTINDETTAIKYFEQAAEKGYKTDLDYYENLGLAYLDHDLDKGVQILNKVLESKPGNSEILFQVAQAYYKAEKYEKAAGVYYQVYQGNNENLRALYMTGVAFQKSGDKIKGVELCEQAIKLDPSLAQLKTQKFSF